MAKPKVVSLLNDRNLQQCFPQLTIMGRPKNIFVECQSYDLIIQVEPTANSSLDIFENAVLRLMSIQVCSADQLAERLCLPADLVKLVILRLQEKGYLANSHSLSEQGAEILGKAGKKTGEPVPLFAKLFFIPQMEQFLPYIHIGELHPVDVIDDTKGITLEFGSRGEPKTVKGNYLRCAGDTPERLNQNECKKAIQRYNRQAAIRGLTPIKLLPNWAIDSTKGERVYFHFQAAIQKGNIDVPVISDGFVQNVDGLSTYLDRQNPELLRSLRQDAATMQINIESKTTAKYITSKYGEVSSRLSALKERLQVIIQDDSGDTTRDEQIIIKQNREDIIRDCAVMLEWAFYYYSVENPISSQLRHELTHGYGSSNPELLVSLAQKAGIECAGEFRHLFSKINARTIRRAESSGVPDFYVNFPLAIAQNGESGGGPVQRLLSENPGMLRFLDVLFIKYPHLRHGGQDNQLLPDARYVMEQGRSCVYALFPELADTENAGESDSFSLNDVSDKRLTACVSLENEMGSMHFNSLPDFVRNEWMRISPDKTGNRLPAPFEYINILYRLLEERLRTYLADKSTVYYTASAIPASKLSTPEGKTLAMQKWGDTLPKTIMSVNDYYFSAAKHGERASLGAYVLYSLCTSGDDEIRTLKELELVYCADQILIMRGHGNNVGLCIDEDALARLRSQVMQLSKYLGGY